MTKLSKDGVQMQTRRDELLRRLEIDLGELLALEGLSEETDACAFMAGSLVEGMGNRSSDIDVLILGNAKPRGEHLCRMHGALYSVQLYGRRRVDFEYWAEADVLGLAEKLAGLQVEIEGKDIVAIEYRLNVVEIMMIHRIEKGMPLLHEARFDALRARFDFPRLARYLTHVQVREVDNALEDVYGMLDDGDVDVGILRARDLADCSVNAYCHHLGNTNVRYKWRARILADLAGVDEAGDVARDYWQLHSADVTRLRTDRDAYRAHMDACIRFANRVTDRIIG